MKPTAEFRFFQALAIPDSLSGTHLNTLHCPSPQSGVRRLALLCVGEWTQVWFSNTITRTHLANGGQGSIPALLLGTFSPLVPGPSSFCSALMSPHWCTPATLIPVGWNQGHDQTILASMLLFKVRPQIVRFSQTVNFPNSSSFSFFL